MPFDRIVVLAHECASKRPDLVWFLLFHSLGGYWDGGSGSRLSVLPRHFPGTSHHRHDVCLSSSPKDVVPTTTLRP